MGLGNSSHSIYLGIVDGKIARRFKEPIQGVTKTRQTSTGKVVHEQLFDHLSGFITDISIVPPKEEFKKYGDNLVVRMVDGDESYTLQMQKDSGYAVAFFKILPNMDFLKRTTIIPNMKMESDKKKVTIFVNQGGTSALKHYYTRDTPNGMPELKKVMLRGEEVWDNFDLMKFFTDQLANVIKPRIAAAANKLPETPQGKPADASVKNEALSVTGVVYEDDLPF